MSFLDLIYMLHHFVFSPVEQPLFIGMKELRAFFQRANVKLSNARLKELIQVRFEMCC